MTITVKLFATLLQYGPESQEITVQEHTTVTEVIKNMHIPMEIPHLRIVNGVHVGLDHTLKEGDVLALFPPIAGGTNNITISC